MDTRELINKLRSAKSRSKRALLDRAADTLEALLSDMEIVCAGHTDPCRFCLHGRRPCCGSEDGCMSCTEECPCKICCSESEGGWEWRGVQRKEAEKMKK